MGGCCSFSSQFIITLASIVYGITGLVLAGASVAGMVTEMKHVLPLWFSIVGLALGLLICVFAFVGIYSVCRSRNSRSLAVFIAFTASALLVSVASTVVVWKYDEALSLAKQQNWVSLDEWEEKAATSLRDGVGKMWDECDAKVEAVDGKPDHYSLSCDSGEFEWFAKELNRQCLHVPVTNSTTYFECYTDASWWDPQADDESKGVAAGDIPSSIDTPKGLFCQCADELVSFTERYFRVGKWLAAGISTFFALTLLASCYLCCCAKERDAYPEEHKHIQFYARP